MDPTPSEVILLHVEFPAKGLAKPVLEELFRGEEVTPHVHRGRITRDTARFEVELTRSTAKISSILELSKKWGTGVMWWNREKPQTGEDAGPPRGLLTDSTREHDAVSCHSVS